jgi:toxin-antitoxin system PIN domain toxin
VIVVDANLLIYAFIRESAHHEPARAWLDRQLNEASRVGLPLASLLAFLRLTTNPRIFDSPPTMARAWRQVSEWLSLKSAWVPPPTQRHMELLGTVLAETGGKSDLVPDAHLATLAIEHGLVLCTTDGDFARFSRLRLWNPLREPDREL